MNITRVKFSLIGSFPLTAGAFMLCIFLFSIGSIIDGALISPFDIIKIFVLFIIIGIVNFFRFYIDKSKWAMSKPMFIKNFIFAPIYLLIAMVMVIWITGTADILTLVFLVITFCIVFMIMQTIVYFIARKNTEKINDALEIFLKEHKENEQE